MCPYARLTLSFFGISKWPARGPFGGNTEVTVTGTNFLPSKYLKCKFGGVTSSGGSHGTYVEDDVSHVVGELGGRVQYISSTEIVCVTPGFGPSASAAQVRISRQKSKNGLRTLFECATAVTFTGTCSTTYITSALFYRSW